jgi:hypothetical protein
VTKKGTFAATFTNLNTEMMKKFAMLATMAALFVACGTTAEETMDNAAEGVDNATEQAGEMIDEAATGMDNAAEATGAAVDSAAAATGAAVDAAATEVKDAVNEAAH